MNSQPTARSVLVLSCVAGIAATSGVQGLAPAMPLIQDHFRLTDSAVGWFTSVYLVPGVLLAFPLGVLGDLVGRRTVWLTTAILFALAGAVSAFAPNYPTLLALRAVQGIGFAAILPMSITILGDALRGAELLRAQGRRAVAMVAGDFALPVVGALGAALSWRAPLLCQVVMLPVGIIGWFVIPAHGPRRRMSTDYRTRLRMAMVQRGMAFVLSVGVIRFLFKFATLTYLPLLLVRSHGASVGQAGIVLAVSALAAAGAATQMARLSMRASVGEIAIVALTCSGSALVLFAVAPLWWMSVLVGVLYGIGDGAVSVIQDTFVVQTVEQSVRAGAVALSGSAKNAGKLAAPLLMSGLVSFTSIGTAFVAMASVAAVGIVIAWRHRDLILNTTSVSAGTTSADDGASPQPLVQ